MSQENANGKDEKKTRKKTSGCLLGLIGFLLGFTLSHIGPYPLPLNTMPIAGTVSILDQNGEAIPFQPTELTCCSRYASVFFRSEFKRTQTSSIDKSGKFSLNMPAFAATLCFLTNDKKYAAVIDITPDMPPTDLTIELIPTHTITGRLIGEKGMPIADQKIKLEYMRFGDYDAGIHVRLQSGPGVTLHSEVTTTDSEGFFSFDNVIPGIKYILREVYFFNPKYDFIWKPLEMPILAPEQYQQPFDIGDVVVR